MASQGPNNGATWVDLGDGFEGPWVNPGNAQFSDDAYATYRILLLDNFSNTLQGLSFGFTIPSDATIDGIEVKVEASVTALADLAENYVDLYKDGVLVNNNQATLVNWPTTDEVRTYGGPTYKWNTTWTPAQVNNAGGFGMAFGFLCTGIGGTFQLDNVTITVYFTISSLFGIPLELFRALGLRRLLQRRQVRRAVWSEAPEEEVVAEVAPGDAGLVNAARRLELRQRAQRFRVLSRPGVEFEEAPPEVLATPPERFVFAMRRLELRRLLGTRAAMRAASMDGGHGEGPFVVEVPTLRALGEFTKREIWARAGLKPGEPPPWRRRR